MHARPFPSKSRPQSSHFRGFTIIEMLVVIGIIAVLLGILLPAIASARSKGLKTEEVNRVRQFHLAWTMYANNNDEAAIPGYLDDATQDLWDVEWRYPSHNVIPADIAAPYTWRLLNYLDNSHEMVHAHLDEANPNMEAEAEEVANEPMFGYNALYVGGWYEEAGWVGPTDNPTARPKFADAHVVATNISHAQMPNQLMLFCTSAVLPEGEYHKWDNSQAGSHYVTPPIVGTTERWTAPSSAEIHVVQAAGDPPTSVPICRYTKAVSLVWVDGSTSAESGDNLLDQRLWIFRANAPNFTHPAP